MTRRFLYVFALWLPLLAVTLVAVGEAFLKRYWWHEMSTATGYFILAGALAGIQYLLFAAAITWRFARMDTSFLTRISWVLPLMFFPLCIIGLWIFFELAQTTSLQQLEANPERVQQDILAFCLRLGMYSVVAGYAYVACLHLFAALLSRIGLLDEWEMDT